MVLLEVRFRQIENIGRHVLTSCIAMCQRTDVGSFKRTAAMSEVECAMTARGRRSTSELDDDGDAADVDEAVW